MDLRSFITGNEQTEMTVEDIRIRIRTQEISCGDAVQKSLTLDDEFRTSLAEGGADEFERTQQARRLTALYRKFRSQWYVLVEKLGELQLLVALDRVISDEAEPTTPLRELEITDDESPPGEHADDPVRRLFERVDRNDVDATINRLDTDETELPFEEQLAAAVEDGHEPPSTEVSLDSIDSDRDERRDRMAALLEQDGTPSVHLWDLLADLDG